MTGKRLWYTIALLIFIFLFPVSSWADTVCAPLSTEEIAGLSKSELDSYHHNVVYSTGDIPPDLEAMNVPRHVDSDVLTRRFYEPSLDGSVSFDAVHDPRKSGKIPAIRYQGGYSTCWAFAACACIEMNLINKNLVDSSIDLSELQLVYSSYNFCLDPLKGFEGDDFKLLGDESQYLNLGGNFIYATQALRASKGVTSEQLVSYSDVEKVTKNGLDNKYIYDYNVAVLLDYYQVDNDINTIKSAILEYGAVQCSYTSSTCWESNKYYNADNAAYYYYEKANTDHAIVIVGWDDNYSADKFSRTPVDSENNKLNGAWICRNSWGEDWGDKGYFYLSYYDKTADWFVVYEGDLKSNAPKNNYQYDGCPEGTYFPENVSVANVFKTKANGGRDEILKAVSFEGYSYGKGSTYNAVIYTDLKSPFSDPTSGTKSATVSGYLNYEGYFCDYVKLDNEVILKGGSYYSVVFEKADGISLFMDCDYSYSGRFSFSENHLIDNHFVSFAKTGDSWNGKDFNFRIKAFSDNVILLEEPDIIPVSSITLSQNKLEINKGEMKNVNAFVSPNNASDNIILWHSENEEVASVSANGTITGISKGETKIWAVSESDSKIAVACNVIVLQPVTSIEIVKISDFSLREDATVTAYKYKYLPNNADIGPIIVESSDNEIAECSVINASKGYGLISVSCKKRGTANITVKAENLSDTTSIKVEPRISQITYTYINCERDLNNPDSYVEESTVSLNNPVMGKRSFGYQFAGWFLDKDGKNEFEGFNENTTGDIHLYAIARPFIVQTSMNKKSLTLNWASVDKAQKYEIYRRKDGKGNYTLVGTVRGGKTTKFVDKNARIGTKYEYIVKAVSSSYSGYSTSTGVVIALDTPKISSLKNQSGKKLSVKYSTIKKCAGYEIRYSTSSKFKDAKTVMIKGDKKTSYVLKKLSKNKTYYISVRAYAKIHDVYSYSDWSNTKKLKVKK